MFCAAVAGTDHPSFDLVIVHVTPQTARRSFSVDELATLAPILSRLSKQLTSEPLA
jgi:hypothetical protein